MISFTCPKPGCGGRQQVGDELAGQEVICLKCLDKVRVPGGVVAKPVPRAAPKASAVKSVPKAAPRVATPRPVASPLPSPPEQERQWFYDLNGAPCGPVGESDLAALAADDRLFPHTLVWSEDQTYWQPAGRVLSDLFEDVTAGDLRPPPARWQAVLGVALVCVAMAAVMVAGLTCLLKAQSDAEFRNMRK